MENITLLNRNAEVLEFFEDFYAGFLQILLQLYILSMQVNNLLDKSSLRKLKLLQSHWLQRIFVYISPIQLSAS